MVHYVSIDIGGTYIKSALLNGDAQLSFHEKVKTPINKNNAIIKQVQTIVANFGKRFDLAGIGISTAGIVNSDQGKVMYAGPTISDYKDTNFKQALSNLRLPVQVENDVNAALLGEWWKGAGRGHDDIYCMTLGTGIGGAYLHDRLIGGAHHQANSIGYMLYDPSSKTNYETRASTSGLTMQIKKQLGPEWTAKQVFSQARKGKARYLRLLDTWVCDVASGLAQIILLVDPELLIIGGGVSRQGDFLLEMITKQVNDFLPKNFMKTEIKMAELFNDAALYGAIYPFFI